MRPSSAPFIHIDPRAPGGLQVQIYQAIRRAILDGSLPAGARLLSSRALARDLRVSRTTSLLAYEQLLAEGYVAPRRGSGTFVAGMLPDDRPQPTPAAGRAATRHPPLSRRGTRLSALPPAALRLPGPPRPFRLGVPALDHFPRRLWAQALNRRVRRMPAAEWDYGEAAGAQPLREAIAAHVSASRGTRCDADEIFVTAGAQRGLALAAQALLDPGDRAIVEDPGYPGAWSALAGAAATLCPVVVDADGIDVAAVAGVRGRPRLAYVTPSHQFPLGVAMSLSRRLALLRWAQDADAWIVEDDYDSEYRYSARPVPCLHGLASDGRVIYVGSFSKTLAPAIRLGFLVVPAAIRGGLAAIRRAADVHPPVLEQLVVADLIADGHYERHLRRVRAACRERLEVLQAGIARHCRGALTLRPVHAGLHVVGDLAAGISVPHVVAAAARLGVEVMPLAAYVAGGAGRSQAILLGFGAVPPAEVFAGTQHLARAIDEARRRARRPGRTRRART